MEPPGPQLEAPEWAGICPPGPKAAQEGPSPGRVGRIRRPDRRRGHESQKHDATMKKILIFLQNISYINVFSVTFVTFKRVRLLNVVIQTKRRRVE